MLDAGGAEQDDDAEAGGLSLIMILPLCYYSRYCMY
jgi:hypothetical protein